MKILIGLYLSLLVVGCSSTKLDPIKPSTINSFNPYMRIFLETSQKAASVYHTISDTPMSQLRGSSSQSVINMINSARDSYRKLNSYRIDLSNLPNGEFSGIANYPDISVSIRKSKRDDGIGNTAIFGSKFMSVSIFTVRGKIVSWHGSRGTGWGKPFSSIVQGDNVPFDRISDIVLEIKRQ